MSKKRFSEREVEQMADNAVRYAHSFPCHLCVYEGPKYTCHIGYKYKGRCPVFKRIQHKMIAAIEKE